MNGGALADAAGVAAAVLDGELLLLGRRLSAFGRGMWALPGGKSEAREDPETALARELLEETGLTARALQLVATQVDAFPEVGLRYTTRFYAVTAWRGSVENREPQKCAGWGWFPIDALPEPLFMIHEETLAALRSLAKRE
jgi:8-oxo-dGTP diphosphatase